MELLFAFLVLLGLIYDLTGLMSPLCVLIGVIFTSEAIPFFSAAILLFYPPVKFDFELFKSDFVAPTNFDLAFSLVLPCPSACFFAADEDIGFLAFVGDIDIFSLFCL